MGDVKKTFFGMVPCLTLAQQNWKFYEFSFDLARGFTFDYMFNLSLLKVTSSYDKFYVFLVTLMIAIDQSCGLMFIGKVDGSFYFSF